MITTNLNAIRQHRPCADGWRKLLAHLGKTAPDDEPLALLTVLESNGLDDALWCLRCSTGTARDARLFAVWCARQVQHVMPDHRSVAAIDTAERFANGQATAEELYAAYSAAHSAAYSAAHSAASYAAYSAASYAAYSAASYAAYSAADSAERSAQEAMLVQMCNGTAPWQTEQQVKA